MGAAPPETPAPDERELTLTRSTRIGQAGGDLYAGVTEMSHTSHYAGQWYESVRIFGYRDRVIRGLVHHDKHYEFQSYAVADLLTDAGDWTRLFTWPTSEWYRTVPYLGERDLLDGKRVITRALHEPLDMVLVIALDIVDYARGFHS